MTASVTENGIFVCGSPYSESNIVAWALAQHPRFMTGPESRFLFKIYGRSSGLAVPFLYSVYLDSKSDGGWLEKQNVSYAEFLRSLGAGVAQLFASRSEGRRWIDSSPENALFIDELLFMFPAATIIGIRESAENAILASLGATWANAGDREVETTLETWRHYHQRLEAAAERTPSRVFVIEQDELLDSPELALGACFRLLGEEPSPAATTFFEGARLRLAPSIDQARRELKAFRTSRRARALISRAETA